LRDYLFAILLIGQENVPLLNCQIRIIHEGIYLEVLLESPEINEFKDTVENYDKKLSEATAVIKKGVDIRIDPAKLSEGQCSY